MNELKLRLMQILNGAWRQRYVIVVPILIMPFVGLAVSHLAPVKYTSHTSMLIQETAKMNPFLEDLAVSSMIKERLTALSTLLKSRHVLTAVATKHQLIDDNTSPQEAEFIINKLAESLSVTQPGKDFLQITFTASSPNGMKELLESISDQFIDQLLAPERSSIEDSANFLAMHIDKRRQELDDAELKLAKFRNQYASVTPEMQSQALGRLASLKQSLAEKQAELAGVKRSLGSLDEQLSKTNPVVGKIEDQIIEIRSELTLLKAKYTDSHSAVKGKERELQRLESEREALLSVKQNAVSSDQLWDIASSTDLDDIRRMQPLLVTQLQSLQVERGRYESLSEETKSLEVIVADLEQQANQFGDNAREMFRLQRDVANKQQLYDELLQRYEMAQLTGSLGMFEQNKRVKIIDLPYTPTTPNNLPTIVFIIAGLFAGIGLGCGIATFIELFDTSIRTRQEIQAITGSPVITSIPKIANYNEFQIDNGRVSK
ncbi:chain-length determining protein [Vibrio cholerae]